ncbi:MgtC/SapB family protein [Amphibacillus jilinensis]|uniref:MgtC/SapB family protein n=1 Tax=Amphibacillus jilinensis TaxID=1216008 RepID=UPI0003818337|nr:MgtC/SapB family protein [Amphibacillus jilinensis]
MYELFDQYFITMSIRLLLALLLSGLIGFEREMNRHSAGFRTHILVGVSSCLMMLMSLYGFQDYLETYADIVRFDPARIPSYVISGIGFLGAGTIIVNGMTVRGLTTAASIWAVAGLGLVVGIGMYSIAILTTTIILLSLVFLNNFERYISKRELRVKLEISMYDFQELDAIFTIYNHFNVIVKNINVDNENEQDTKLKTDVQIGKNTNINDLYYELLQLEQVKQVKEV